MDKPHNHGKRRLIVGKVEHAVKEADDSWQHHELLPLYVQLALLERLESINGLLDAIDSRLISIEGTLEAMNIREIRGW